MINELFDIISDNPKLKKLSADPTLLKEGQLQRFLRKLKDKYFFTKEIYDNIYPPATKPLSVYGIPRIHKLNVKKKDNLSFSTYNYYLQNYKRFVNVLWRKKERKCY